MQIDLRGLRDEEIELRLIRTLDPGDTASRPPNARLLACATEHRFSIHRVRDGVRVGRIHIRILDDPDHAEELARTWGHLGYEVLPEHRKLGYATRAIRVLLQVASRARMRSVWGLVEPDNAPSRAVLERAGFTLVDQIETATEARAVGGLGAEVCRYRIEL